jgi:hypothetical protein
MLANRSESGRNGKMPKIENFNKSAIMRLAKRQVRTDFFPLNIIKRGSESRHGRQVMLNEYCVEEEVFSEVLRLPG